MAITIAPSALTRQLLEAVGRFAAARLRRLGALGIAPDWQARASLCQRCPLRVVRDGVAFCGTPYLQQIDRDPAVDGCGCPCRDKAKSPQEHCPVNAQHHPARRDAGTCSCKWCMIRQATIAA